MTYDQFSHLKRALAVDLDAFKQGHATKAETLDLMAFHALEYHAAKLKEQYESAFTPLKG